MLLEEHLVGLRRHSVLLGLAYLLDLLWHVLLIGFLRRTRAALFSPCLIHAEPLVGCLGVGSCLLVTMVHSSVAYEFNL